MTYDEIKEVVKQKMSEVIDELDSSTVDPQRNMKDYGADSLEIVEIVSRTVKALQIKVSRSEVASAKNIDDLIKLIEKHSQDKR